MSKILLISSGPSIAQYGLVLQKTLPDPENLFIVNYCMEDALDYVRNQLPEDIDVIIARGNTAKLLKAAHLPIPIVTIPIQDSELIQSINTAKRIYTLDDSSIAYLGLEDVIQSVQEFLKLLHCKIKLYPVHNSQDIQFCIQKAKREQVRVVIGGIYTQKIAAQYGISSVLLESTLSSVKEAYNRALEVQKGFILQRKKIQERSILINANSDGILSVNENGKITICNPAAEKYLKCTSRLVCGKPFHTLFPQTENECIRQAMFSGQELLEHTFFLQNNYLSLSVYPLFASNDCHGAILAVHPASPKKLFTETHSTISLSETSDDSFSSFFELIGKHPDFQAAISAGIHYAKLSEPILIIGENGTGKETFARCIHKVNHHNAQLFISRDASLLTVEDIFSADHGTLYLRNGHLLSPTMQNYLADALRTKSIQLKNNSRKALSLRLIIGSEKNLSLCFSPEFYYLINTLIIPLPTLRQRSSDIPLLVNHILKQYNAFFQKKCTLSSSFLQKLQQLTWKGNIRQLENYLKRLILLSGENQVLNGEELYAAIEDSHFYQYLDNELPKQPSLPCSENPGFSINGSVITFEQLKELDHFYCGKKSAVAAHLGISRSTLWRYFKIMDEAQD